MADLKASKQQTQRSRLIDIIPLDTPLSMQIELASSCNFHCRFCMHHDDSVVRENMRLGVMDAPTFRNVVEGMKRFPHKIKYVTLQSRGESLINKDIVSMLRILKEADVVEKVGLYTNGTLLDNKTSDGLISEGLDVLHISVNGITKEQYYNVTGTNVDVDALVENVRYFYEHKKNTYVYVKTMENDITDNDRDRFLELYSSISDEVFIERPVDAWKGAGIDTKHLREDRYKLNGSKVQICPRLFFAFVVHFDGTVVACDHDWSEKYIIGNANKESVYDIWTNDLFNNLRKKHLNQKADEIDRCRECIQRTECLDADNIDGLLGKDIYNIGLNYD